MVAVWGPRRRSARCWSSGSLTSAWMPDRNTTPSSWRYLASSEKSRAIGMDPPGRDRRSGRMIRALSDGRKSDDARSRLPMQMTIMIEGQEGLTWERWRQLARTVEDAGYAGLFRSDHLTGLFGDPTRPSLDVWASLTWLASNTERLRFGPLVCPLTFYHPALLAKRAAAVAELSGGRLDLGIGAGWHEGEHAMFGIPFPPLKERMDRFECGARVIRALWRGQPAAPQPLDYPLPPPQYVPHPRRRGGGSRWSSAARASAGRCASWPSTRRSGTRRASRSTTTRPSGPCWRV